MLPQANNASEQDTTLHAAVSRDIKRHHRAFVGLCGIAVAMLAATGVLVAIWPWVIVAMFVLTAG